MPEIKPNPGPQTEALRTKADICIFGGAGGGGKSHALLLEPLRHIENPKFGGVIFRRTTKQIRNEGGLWDSPCDLYSRLGAQLKSSSLECIFPSGMKIKFSHLEHQKNMYDFQGSQIPFIGWDELTHFSESQFWYLLSRCRSDSGVPGYIRATTNPDADSWVRKLIDWWVDPQSGYPIQERSGVLRWFIRLNDELHWGDSKQELLDRFGADVLPKSLTFIPSKLEDNPILMEKDPSYKANLDALPLVERMRMRDGNWNIKFSAGNFFKKEWFEIVDTAPPPIKTVRYWDRASTEPSPSNPDPDSTSGLKVMRGADGIFYVLDWIEERVSTHKVETMIKNTASQDGLLVSPWLEVDPGQAGVLEKNYYVKLLAGYDVHFNRPTTKKEERAKIPSAQAEPGNVKLLRGSWNEKFLNQLQAFPEGKHDDGVDSLSGAIAALTQTGAGESTDEMVQTELIPIVDQDISQDDASW